jgi:hypothetical protein
MQETFDMLVRFNERMIKDYLEFFPTKPISINSGISAATANTESSMDLQEGGSQSVDAGYLAAVKKNKKDNMTPAMWNMACLCGIPGVSTAIAVKIAEKYPTLRALLDAYQTCPDINARENLLADIILTETDKQRRRIGGVVSKRICEYFQA